MSSLIFLLLNCLSLTQSYFTELGLSHLPAVSVGSAVKDFTRSLQDSQNVKCVCVCQTIYRTGARTFDMNVILLNRDLKVMLEPVPYAMFWVHEGFWRAILWP